MCRLRARERELRDPMLGVQTRRRVATRFATCVLGEHLNERISQVLTRGGEIGVPAPAVDLAAPMASANGAVPQLGAPRVERPIRRVVNGVEWVDSHHPLRSE